MMICTFLYNTQMETQKTSIHFEPIFPEIHQSGEGTKDLPFVLKTESGEESEIEKVLIDMQYYADVTDQLVYFILENEIFSLTKYMEAKYLGDENKPTSEIKRKVLFSAIDLKESGIGVSFPEKDTGRS